MTADMSELFESIAPATPTTINDCWNHIGIRGDGSCRDLLQHVHCRNCPAYVAAASVLLDRVLSETSVGMWDDASTALRSIDRGTESMLIFRLGQEWLGLATALVQEVAEMRQIHSLPHQRHSATLGVTNIRGALTICVSLQRLLGSDNTGGADKTAGEPSDRRLLVMINQGQGAVVPVDEVFGLHRYAACELKHVPTTLNGTVAAYVKGVVAWRDKAVGLLDGELLFYTLNRSLA